LFTPTPQRKTPPTTSARTTRTTMIAFMRSV
jgi:hypothetical protein